MHGASGCRSFLGSCVRFFCVWLSCTCRHNALSKFHFMTQWQIKTQRHRLLLPSPRVLSLHLELCRQPAAIKFKYPLGSVPLLPSTLSGIAWYNLIHYYNIFYKSIKKETCSGCHTIYVCWYFHREINRNTPREPDKEAWRVIRWYFCYTLPYTRNFTDLQCV